MSSVSITSSDVRSLAKKLIVNLVNIKDVDGFHTIQLRDGSWCDTRSWSGWEWTQGIGLLGMWKFYELTQDKDVYEELVKWYDLQFSKDTVEKNINTMAVFTALINLYEHTKNQKYLPYIKSWADWAYRSCPRTKFGGLQHYTYLEVNEDQMWDDTLMMTTLPLARAGIAFDKPEYIEEAKYQFMLHVQYLFDNESGLFYHGFCFQGNHHFGKVRWGRGNSWVTIFIPDFLEILNLKPTDPFYRFAVGVLESQVQAIEKLQDEKTGLFRTILNGPKTDENYLESTCTAGFAYGIMKSIRLGYLDAKYKPIALKAFKAVTENIDKDGELLRSSAGTGMGDSEQFYYNIRIESMPYGQAMAVMCLVEYLQEFI